MMGDPSNQELAMTVRPRLALNRETLHHLTPTQFAEVQGGGFRTDIIIRDTEMSVRVLCSVGTGSTGLSQGCTSLGSCGISLEHVSVISVNPAHVNAVGSFHV
jgi:hypothetical protein